jgi:hypothetical protein
MRVQLPEVVRILGEQNKTVSLSLGEDNIVVCAAQTAIRRENERHTSRHEQAAQVAAIRALVDEQAEGQR